MKFGVVEIILGGKTPNHDTPRLAKGGNKTAHNGPPELAEAIGCFPGIWPGRPDELCIGDRMSHSKRTGKKTDDCRWYLPAGQASEYGGVFSFCPFSLDKQRKGTRHQAEPEIK